MGRSPGSRPQCQSVGNTEKKTCECEVKQQEHAIPGRQRPLAVAKVTPRGQWRPGTGTECCPPRVTEDRAAVLTPACLSLRRGERTWRARLPRKLLPRGDKGGTSGQRGHSQPGRPETSWTVTQAGEEVAGSSGRPSSPKSGRREERERGHRGHSCKHLPGRPRGLHHPSPSREQVPGRERRAQKGWWGWGRVLPEGGTPRP